MLHIVEEGKKHIFRRQDGPDGARPLFCIETPENAEDSFHIGGRHPYHLDQAHKGACGSHDNGSRRLF